MSLTKERLTYKPFQYPWAYEAWKLQQQLHWMPEEVPLNDDVRDWKQNLTDSERNLLTHIFRFFTQADVEVANCYMREYSKVFKPTEVLMMLTSFANMETVHIAAYSHLLDTIGMPETEYEAFLKYKQMREKHEYLQGFDMDTPQDVALTMAAFGGFVEGLQLFASFAILLNFPRFNKMKGMGQIITWSVRDETLHCNSIIKLFHTYLAEHPGIDRQALTREIAFMCDEMVRLEEAFVDLAFEMGGVQGLVAEDVKTYVRYVADCRLQQLGCPPMFNVKTNPLSWLDEQLNAVEHANFFEARSTEYSKGATEGTWGDVFS